MRRHEISDDNWSRIEHLLPGRPGGHGGVARDNRGFINAVWYVAKTGIPCTVRAHSWASCVSLRVGHRCSTA